MADLAKQRKAFFFLIISTIISISQCWDDPYRERLCGVLHAEDNSTGSQFKLKDGEESTNLFEDHRTSSAWNSTGSIVIQQGCQMQVCNETYFDGTCDSLGPGSHLQEQLAAVFTGEVGSVSCNCERECRCEDIHMKKRSCARAYLEGGCKICNSLYTDMSGSELDFRAEFRGKVEAFRLRKGCTLTLYPDEEMEGEGKIIYDEIVENYNGTFGSYECECNDDEYVPPPTPPRPPTFPPLVDVPESVDEIIGMLRNGSYGRHPGLVAALNSMKGKRSGKNAYILLLGSTGAGKSSAINLLFDNPDITKTGDTVSTTTDIHEFRVPVPIDELGIANSELRVIDTPGLGDTRGLEQDAKFLATFESFLDKHEELKDRIPNVVLIFHKYNDNRFKGEGANFVKMIRGLDHFRSRITDENFSNVIFVFSHFCSETPANKRRPTARLNQFKQVIEDYSSFPKPILLAVAENKAKQEWQLPVLNGFYKMPNNEYYPRNLFDKLELVTKNGGDMVGMGVFRTAFRNSENFNVTPSDFTLVDKDSTSVTKFLRILSNAVIGVVETEVSRMLDQTWESEVPTPLKKQFHNSLQVLQKTLHLRNIIGKQDLPKTATDILHLLTAIKHDEATRLLLEKGLGIKPPVFSENPIAGHGYNVFMDRHLATSPFDLQENTLSDIGFMIPKVLTCKLDKDTTQNFRRFADKEEYIQHRLHSLGIKGELPPSSFKGVTKAGHNIESESFKNDSCSLSATREFRFFDFIINDRVPFTKEFESDVKSLPVFDQGNHESVTKWNAFFNEYGTHVVKSVHGGGAIEITLESEEPFNNEMSQALFDVIKFAEDMTFLIEDDSNGTSNGTRTVLKEGTTHSLTFHGGNPKFYTSDLTKLGIEEAVNLMNNWKNSLKYNPAVLTTEMRLEPMSHVVRKLGQNYTSEIEKATELLFNASLTYDPNVAKASQIPPPRDQTAFLDAIAQMNKQMQAILLQNAEAQRRSEERQHNMTLARMEFEREEKERERIYQMQLEQARQNATIHQQKLQADLEQQRIKAANETEQRHKALVNTMIKAQEDADARAAETNRAAMEAIRKAGERSCLKAGTKILMADFSEKNVELLKKGDVVLDKDLRPTRVLGVAYEFLFNEKFYGFDDKSFFFTSNHLFAGPSLGAMEDLQLYAKCSKNLLSQNPLMKYLNVEDMDEHENLQLFKFLRKDKSVDVENIGRISKDPRKYSPETLVYDIQVDSPSGTYFANGYVCRHEIPPVEYWPNTMSILFPLMGTEHFEKLAEVPYTIENVEEIEALTSKVAAAVKKFLQEDLQSEEDDGIVEEIMDLGDVDVDDCLGKIFNNPSVAATALSLYAKVGPVVAPHLDEVEVEPRQLAKIQHDLYQIMSQTLNSNVS